MQNCHEQHSCTKCYIMRDACLNTNSGVSSLEFVQKREDTNYSFWCCGTPRDRKWSTPTVRTKDAANDSLVPRPSHCLVFNCLQYAKTERGKAWSTLLCE